MTFLIQDSGLGLDAVNVTKEQVKKKSFMPKEVSIFSLLYCQNDGFLGRENFILNQVLENFSPNYLLPTIETLKQDSFKKSFNWSKKILEETVYMPYLAVFVKQHEGTELMLSIAFDQENRFFYVEDDAIRSGHPNLDAKLSSFIQDSVNIVSSQLQKNRYHIYDKINFVIVDSEHIFNLDLSVAISYSAKFILNFVVNYDNTNVLRGVSTARIREEMRLLSKFLEEINSLKLKLAELTLAEIAHELLEMIISYSESYVITEGYQEKILDLLEPIYLVSNVLHTEHMGKRFFYQQCQARAVAFRFFTKHFEELDVSTMFLEKRGEFFDSFDAQGKLKIDYRKFWPRYRLYDKRLSLLAQ